MIYKTITLLFSMMAIFGCHQSSAQFTIADQDDAISIVYDIKGSELDSIAAHLLARDIKAVTGQQPEVYTNLQQVEGNAIILGDITSDLISSHVDTARLSGRWETYGRLFKAAPAAGIGQAMFIAGSDPRGTLRPVEGDRRIALVLVGGRTG